MTEVIKEIRGWEGRYTISDQGVVRSLLTGKVMKPYVTKFGYARVNLRKANSREYKSYFIHRLVAMNFLSNPNGFKEVNHKDSNRLNNKANNLEWCDREYNVLHSFVYGNASHKGLRNPNARLNEEDVKAIRALKKTQRFYNTDIAKLFKVSPATIDCIVRGDTWSDN